MNPFFSESDIKLSDLEALCAQQTDLKDYSCAAEVFKNVLIYNYADCVAMIDEGEKEQALKAEFTKALNSGPGVIAIKGAMDPAVVDKSTEMFFDIIKQEKAAGSGQGDHFGNNERVWNSLQKACEYDPDLFIDYYKNPLMALVCQAWLGPNYQMSAQINNVKPGGKAQSAHRDYHLGFQSPDTVAQYPAHAQMMSQYLTLQGGIVHVDMPLETGPTLFLPYSQQLKAGYMAYTRPEFRNYFDENHVQIPFEKGDMMFFSPALFHGAGNNVSSGDRLANLVQISSAFGRTMETINRYKMMAAIYPALQKRLADRTITDRELKDTIACVAEGYSFPTNLDSDPPVGGNAPETAAQMMHKALANGLGWEQLEEELAAYAERQKA
ncbi:MAG: phytanoyl-CoA dioxygenase family protein [Chloroflexota bacterium]